MDKIVRKQPYRELFENIRALLNEARNAVVQIYKYRNGNDYFEIGRMIVLDERHGEKRAEYAEETLKNLSLDLTREFGNHRLPNLKQTFCGLQMPKYSSDRAGHINLLLMKTLAEVGK